MAARSGIKLDHDQIAAMLIPNTREVRYLDYILDTFAM
jgi:hypothetical protein